MAADSPRVPLPSAPPPPPDSPLRTLSRFQIQPEHAGKTSKFLYFDRSGQPLGEAQFELALPVKYTLRDTLGHVLLVLDAARGRGLRFEFQIHDGTGAVLAGRSQPSSFGGYQLGVQVRDQEALPLEMPTLGDEYRLEEGGGAAVVAAGHRSYGWRSSVAVDISEAKPTDHRVVIGAMMLALFTTSAR
ncbi:MAG: hypothetical protein ACRECT_03700 [Thermoplasmata archaeon]